MVSAHRKEEDEQTDFLKTMEGKKIDITTDLNKSIKIMYLTQFNWKKGCYNNMGLTRLKRKFKTRRLTIQKCKRQDI